MTDQGPEPTPLASFAEDYVVELAALDPIVATFMGVPGHEHELPEFTTERYERDTAFVRGAREVLRGIEPWGDHEQVAKAVMLERLDRLVVLGEHRDQQRSLSVISSPVSEVRQVFELMDPRVDQGAAVLTARLAAVRGAMEGWRRGLSDLARCGELPARRHIVGIARQARTYAGGRAFEQLAAARDGAKDRDALVAAGRDADAACAELAEWLDRELVDKSSDVEASGPERYARWTGYYCGADFDLRELYEWGWEDLSRIHARMWELADVLAPGSSRLTEVAEACDADDAKAVFGVDQVLDRLRAFTDATVASLRGSQFDIDERIAFCDVRVAPEGSAAAPYYIEPSDDLSRPGTTWLPTLGRTRFPWWRLASTWYHEAVPGHHLQGATCAITRDRLNRFQRQVAWTSGYGEGWALYAERLMDELGAFEDPADELGYLEGQALRAARIVVDLGLHLGFEAPSDLGELAGEDASSRPWTPELAVALLIERAIADPEMAASEVDRYLGWPGQAISYKAGERVWLASRAAAKARLGARFDLKRFHAHALALGPMGLDPLRDELARWDGA